MHINYKNFINRILKFDNLYKNVDFEKFNFEERELLKNLGYTNQQLNFLNKYVNNKNYTQNKNCFKIKKIFSIKKKIKFFVNILRALLSILKKKENFENFDTDIIFFLSTSTVSQIETKKIIKNFPKRLLIIDKPVKKYNKYKLLFPKSKIINIRNNSKIIDLFFALIKSLKFKKKFLSFKKINIHPDINFSTYFNFFLKIEIYKRIIKTVKSNNLFIDRGDGLGNNFFISYFKKFNKKNKVYSYTLGGVSLGGDLIFAHYFYSNIDVLFCYGEADKKFITNLFSANKFKLLKKPKYIIPVGSIKNYGLNIINKNKSLRKEKINFLYIKSNRIIYNGLDLKCFEKFCYFVNTYFPYSNILVKERPGIGAPENINLVDQKILKKQNIFIKANKDPVYYFNKADFVVGTTSIALSQAIYHNIPTIILDNKIMINSTLKFYSSIYINSIDRLENYSKKIIKINNIKKYNYKCKNFIFKKVKSEPSLKITNIIKNKI
tara:strand:+ start:19630 stop:21108 length:1479 start_codon:yes stop_codon:yes gene_type:complete